MWCCVKMANGQDSLCQPVFLEPFIHQVGGSSSLLELDSSTICKPLIPHEKLFYENLPDSIKSYTPEYKGVIEVSFSEDSEGYLVFSAKTSRNFKLPQNTPVEEGNPRNAVARYRLRVCRSGSIDIVSTSIEAENEQEKDDKRRNWHNPWVLHCHQEHLSKIHNHPNSSIIYTQKYILLENLTSKYHYPCVLDIKMGIRQYGDDAPISKQKSQDAKVSATTSGKLGLRICGMQVYHLTKCRYVCHNKYYGRALSVDGFRQTLVEFLHNGQRLRTELMQPLIEMLRKLQQVIQTLNTFRFFTSSLLVTYDGKDNWKRKTNDTECELPLETDLRTELNSTRANVHSEENGGSQCLSANTVPALIDVKMIDFAHSTFNELPGDMVKHIGPDDGYLFGLENLILQLDSINQEYQNNP